MDMNVEDQYMDDLFGDGGDNVNNDLGNDLAHHIANTAAPVPKGLPERLDVLAACNCCSKIAWSRFGCIASVAEQGRRLDLRLQQRNAKTGEWQLQKPTSIYPPLPNGSRIAHVSFSAMGNDVAVLTTTGRLLLYTTGFTLTTLMPVHASLNDSTDEINQVVGLHWLPVFPHTQKSTMFWNASRKGNGDWSARSGSHATPGPANPLEGKSALLTLSRKGTLRLLWQARNAPWSEISVPIELGEGDEFKTLDHAFTHAAFAPTKDGLMAAAVSVNGKLRVYQIKINWNMPETKEGNPQANAQATPAPTLDINAIIEEADFGPSSLSAMSHNPSTNGHTDLPHASHLTKLLFVPPAPEQGTRDKTTHTIVAGFTIVPPRDPLMMEAGAQWGQANAIVARWEVQTGISDKLSGCFDKLSVKKKTVSAAAGRERAILQRVDDIIVSPAILAIRPIRNNTMYVLTLIDGTVQFRHRATLDIVLPDENPDEVSTLPQSGFAYPALSSPLHTAFSPGACVVAALGDGDKVKLERMQYTGGAIAELAENDSKHDALAALVALQYSSACTQYKVTDDLLSLLPSNASSSLTRQTINLSLRFLNIDFDLLSGDVQKMIFPLFRNHLAARCFSMQNALGAADRSGPKQMPARLAWITMNLRHVSQHICFNLSKPDAGLRPETALSIVGLVKWSLDLCVYILQELLHLHYTIKHEAQDGHPSRETDLAWIQLQSQRRHSPALVLLLSSIPRLFLRVVFRPLRYAYAHSSKGFQNTELPNDQRGMYHKLLGVFNSTPVNHTSLVPMEEFLVDIENTIKEAYSTANVQPGPHRLSIEREMFVTSQLPICLLPAITQILTTKLDTLLDKIDTGKVHIHDISWLGLTDDKRTRDFCAGHVIDVVRKMPLASRGTRLRRCPRCGSVMEDIGGSGDGGGMAKYEQWVWSSHKVCVCFSSWGGDGGVEEEDGVNGMGGKVK